MKLLADRLTGEAQARASASYTRAFAVGSCYFFAAGFLSEAFGWEAAFLARGGGSLLSIPMATNVSFSPGARTVWLVHLIGQTL